MDFGIEASLAIAGFALWEMYAHYRDTAPKLCDLRDSSGDAVRPRQELLDADLLVGGLTFLAAGAASLLSKSWVPLALGSVGFGLVSLYYHQVLSSRTIAQIEKAV